MEGFTDWIIEEALGPSIKIAITIVLAVLLTRVLRRAVRKVEAKVSEHTTPMRAMQRTQTLTKVLTSAGIVAIWVIAGFYVLSALGQNLGPLLAGVGIIGLAVGFGAQNLVRDVVSGFFILFEDQYGVGDIVEINEVAAGKVEQLTLRVTGLRALDGTMHFVPNGDINHVANRSKEWARAVVDVGVAYKERPSKVRRVLEEVAVAAKAESELGRDLYAVPEILGVEGLGEYEVTWRLMAETKPGKQFTVARALRERIKVAFDQSGIEIPFPHRVMVSADRSPTKDKAAADAD
jgi:moderate conductance mechanosensitive channel